MDRNDAKAILLRAWNGAKDSRLPEALRVLGIDAGDYTRLDREARRVTRGGMPGLILTPANGKVR